MFILGGPKVYDVTKYLNDHPGGPEIILDVAGKDADDMFEDMGHSQSARDELKKYLIGTLKVDPEAQAKKKIDKKATSASSGKGLNPVAVVALIIAVLVGYYFSNN